MKTVKREGSPKNLFVWLTSVAFGVFLVIYIYLYESNIRDATLEQMELELSETSERLEAIVTNAVSRYKADLRFLHYTPPISGLARANANQGVDPFDQTTFSQWKRRLETIFNGFLENNLAIEQLRLIEVSAEGKELIRVQRRAGAIEVVPSHELQAKAGEQYYLPSTQLSPKQIYMSPLSLNREFGEIVFPYKPMLRFSMPVFDDKGRRYAFLIMNINANNLIKLLSNSVFDYSELVISGSDGDIIYHPIAEYRFTRDLAPEIKWDNLYVEGQSFQSIKQMTKRFDDYASVYVFSKKVKTRAEVKYGHVNFNIVVPESYFEGLLNDKRVVTYTTISALLFIMTIFLLSYYRNAQRAQLLADTRREASAIVDGSQDAIVGLNLDGEITSLNNAAQVMLKLASDTCLGKHFNDIKLINQLPISKYIELLNHSGMKVQEEQSIEIEGKKQYFSVSVSAVLSELGSLSGIALIIRDISNEKEAELKIKRLNSELESKVRHRTRALAEAKEEALKHSDFKSEFISNVSHELRTPLNGVIGTLNILKRENLDEKPRRLLEMMELSALNLSLLINDILDLSKIEAGKLDINPSPFDPVELIESVAQSSSVQAQEKGLELLVDTHELNCSEIHTDPLRFTQILNNLLNNAIKFTELGFVKLTAKGQVAGDNYRVEVIVEDSGLGISKSVQQKLFDAYTQASIEIVKEYGGTGLGLSICKRLSKLMGGDIEFSSIEGEGSVFSFHVAVPLDKTVLIEKQQCLKGSHCLLLMQQGEFKNHFSKLLAVNGAKARSLAIDEAEELDKKEPFDFIFMDSSWFNLYQQSPDVTLCFEHFSVAKLVLFCEVTMGEITKLNPVYKRLTKPVTQSDLLRLTGQAPRGQGANIITLEDTSTTQYTIQEINSLSGSRVLLVDDNEVNIEVASGLLSGLPIELAFAHNGKEALELLQASSASAKPFNCILMDCQMPIMNGYQASEKIRVGEAGEQFSSIPIIAMTANAMMGEKEKCLLSGMNDYLSKPLNATQLRNKVIQLLLKSVKPSQAFQANEGSNHQKERLPVEAQDEQLWSAKDALERLMNNASLMQKVLSLFVSSVPEKMEKLQKAVESKDTEEIVQLAHSLKGLCGEICAYQLHTLFSEVESKASNGDMAFTMELQRVKTLMPKLIESIKTELES